MGSHRHAVRANVCVENTSSDTSQKENKTKSAQVVRKCHHPAHRDLPAARTQNCDDMLCSLLYTTHTQWHWTCTCSSRRTPLQIAFNIMAAEKQKKVVRDVVVHARTHLWQVASWIGLATLPSAPLSYQKSTRFIGSCGACVCVCAHDLEAMKRLECARLLSPPPPGMSDTGVGEAIKFRRTSASSSCRSSCSLIARSWPLISRC